MKMWRAVILAAIFAALAAPAARAAEHRFGLGLHFWKTVDDLAGDGFDNIEEDGLAWTASYQLVPAGLFRFEIDLEYAGDGFGGATDSSLSTLGFVLIGGDGFYGGLGIGVTFADTFEDDLSDPFYAARIGYDFALLAGIRLDIHANYRAGAFDELDEADTDAITLGAAVRFSL